MFGKTKDVAIDRSKTSERRDATQKDQLTENCTNT